MLLRRFLCREPVTAGQSEVLNGLGDNLLPFWAIIFYTDQRYSTSGWIALLLLTTATEFPKGAGTIQPSINGLYRLC